MKKSDRREENEQFFFILDKDRKIFSVHGPMHNDTRLTNEVAAYKEVNPGRAISMSGEDSVFVALNAVASIQAQFRGYAHVAHALSENPQPFVWDPERS